ncbi:MAG: hypothetical protein ABFS17_03115 [Chloroflexota bacterium]
MHIQPPVNLRSFGIYDFTLKIYRANFKTLFQLSLLYVLPRFLYKMVLILPLRIIVTKQTDTLFNLIFIIWGLIPIIGIILITENTIRNQEFITFKKAIQQGFSHWGSALGIYIILILNILVITIIAGIVGSLIVMIFSSLETSFPIDGILSLISLLLIIGLMGYWQFILKIIILRPDKKTSPIKRSRNLVKDQWWQGFGYNLAIILPIGLLYYVIFFVVRFIVPDMIGMQFILTSIISLPITPVSTIYTTLLFIMLEARKAKYAPVEPSGPIESEIEQLPG